MNKKPLIYRYIAASMVLSAAIAATPAAVAQTPRSQDVMSSSADGSLSRAADMMRHADYAGAIDQLNHALGKESPLWSSAVADNASDLRRQAIAMMLRAAFERGDETLFTLYYEHFLADYPGYPEALEAQLMHADFLFFKQDYPAAVEAYSKLDFDALDPAKEALYRYRLALSLTRSGFFTEASNIFTLLRGNPDYSGASRFYLAYIDYVRGNLTAARSGFNEVPTAIARELGADYYIAQIDFEEGDFRGVTQRAAALLPSARKEWQPELNRIIGESYYNLGDAAAAEPYLRRYIDTESSPRFSALYDLGVICYDSGAYDEARKYFSRLTGESNAMAQSAYLYLGQLEALDGDYSAAAMAFNAAYELDIDSKVSETALYNYAVATMKGGQVPFGSSSKMLENFVKRYPDSAYAAKIDEYLATACFNEKDYAGALRHIERLRRPTRANLDAKQKILFQLGVQSMSLKQYGEAAGYMQRASSMASEADKSLAVQASLWQGDALYAMGDYAAATKAYTRFVKESGAKTDNRALALYNLGYSLYQEKHFADARRRFSEALAAKPELSPRLAADCRLRVADCDYYAGNVSAAMSGYASLAADTDSPEADYAAFQHANMLGASGDNHSKIKELETMLRRWPQSAWIADARLELVNALCATRDITRASDEAASMIRELPSAPQTRKAALAVAAAWQEKDDYAKAIAAYQALVRRWPTSAEAETAVSALKTIYTDEGDMQGFLAFLDSVPSAPRPDASEMEQIAFDAALSKVQRNNTDITPLTDYLAKYPEGSNADRAMLTIADICREKGNDAEALNYLNRLLSSRPDSESVPAALMMKAQILEKSASKKEAAEVWNQLLGKGGSLYTPEALAGLMRTADNPTQKLEYANRLLDISGLDADMTADATLAKGEALAQTGHNAEAVSILRQLAKTPQTEQGAHAAVLLGEILLAQGDTTQAQKQLSEFIDSDTSQFYWLARGYIALADTYHAQGNNYKAKEYLRALKNNYPGKEADIRKMIESRLAEWK